jgi:DNA-binding GntR family transcriptional regulator
LRQQILAGELRPGTPLREVPLAASLGVSRNTMREGMRILALEGLLKRYIHRGVSVAQLSRKDVQEIYHLRRMLEIPAIFAATPPCPEILDKMSLLVDEYEAAMRARDWVLAVEIDFRFHSHLVRFHRNKRLESVYQKLAGELRMGMVLVDRTHDDPAGLIPIHRKMYELLAAGKLKQCAAVLARHLDDSESRLSAIMDNQSILLDRKAGGLLSRSAIAPNGKAVRKAG